MAGAQEAVCPGGKLSGNCKVSPFPSVQWGTHLVSSQGGAAIQVLVEQ